MRNRFFILLLFFLATSALCLKSSAAIFFADSSKVAVPYNKNKILKARSSSSSELESSVNNSYHLLDTALNGFQRSNTALNPYNPQRYLGIMISPQQPLVFNPFVKSTIRVGFDALRNTEILADDITYFRAMKRYTNIYYHFGRYHEQLIDVLHTQNITKGLNMGFVLHRAAGDGQMARQAEYNGNLYGFGSFISKNQRYGNYFNAGMNALELDANGGLYSDNLFEQAGRISTTLPVNISDAVIKYNSKFATLHQHFDVGNHYKNNPADTAESLKFKPWIRFSHTINYERKGYSYSDQSLNVDQYYFNYFISPYQTFDTTGYLSVLNRVGISTIIDEQLYEQGVRQNYIAVGGNYQYLKYMQQYVHTNYTNTFFDGAVKSISKKTINAGFKGLYNSQGINAGNYSASVFATHPLCNSRIWIGINANIQKASPELMMENYYSNNFLWKDSKDSVKPSEYKKIALSLESIPYLMKAELGYVNVYNYVGINGLAAPFQYHHDVGLWQIKLYKDFNFWKFRLNNAVIYQKLNGVNKLRLDILRVPEWITYQSLYFHDRYFRKNALHLMIGVDIYYRSAYFGDAFMSATALFYRQNDVQLGNYVIVDPFINMQIKTVKIFLKYEYVNRGILRPAYYEVPHYPVTTGVFRIGINWSFFD